MKMLIEYGCCAFCTISQNSNLASQFNDVVDTEILSQSTDLFSLKGTYDTSMKRWVSSPSDITVKNATLNTYFSVGGSGTVVITRYNPWLIAIEYFSPGGFITAYTNYQDSLISFYKIAQGDTVLVQVSNT